MTGCCAGGNAVGAGISAATGVTAGAGRIGCTGGAAGVLAGWMCIFWPELISGRRIGAGLVPVMDVSRTMGLWPMMGLLVLDAGALPGRITSNTGRCGRGGSGRPGRCGRLGFIVILYLQPVGGLYDTSKLVWVQAGASYEQTINTV